MVRSAAAMLAVLILPTFALAQEPQGTHTVVDHDTLWDLAQRYYSNPFEWRVIWNANRDVVEDPNWIYPDEVIVIPGLPGDVAMPDDPPMDEPTDEAVDEPDEIDGVPVDLVPFGLRRARPITEGARTVFYVDTAEVRVEVEQARSREYAPVSRDAAYSAPWMIGLEGDPENQGHILGYAERGRRAAAIRAYERIRITMPSPARVGARLQLYRVDRTIEAVGQVVIPTGIAEVQTIGDGEVVAVVVKEYNRVTIGDFVGPLPTYSGEVGVYAQDISGGSEAMIMGFAGDHALTDLGHMAFLDLGSDDGIKIGDEFVLFGEAIPTARDGVLQVVGTSESMATARVLSMRDNVFRQGVVVRLTKKMR
jgi:bifunctional DNA-binding transcriptional regulator/antitoxin component of YhaV-PrlF toxin-antitoxin module